MFQGCFWMPKKTPKQSWGIWGWMTRSEQRVTESGETFPCRWKDLCFQHKRDLVWWIFPSIVLTRVETPHLHVSSETFSVRLIQLLFFSFLFFRSIWNVTKETFALRNLRSASPNIPKVYVAPGQQLQRRFCDLLCVWISVEGLAFAVAFLAFLKHQGFSSDLEWEAWRGHCWETTDFFLKQTLLEWALTVWYQKTARKTRLF